MSVSRRPLGFARYRRLVPVTPIVLLLAALVCGVRPAAAQGTPLVTLRWQLAPYCNVLTLQVEQRGTTFRVRGTDDQCGAARRAGVVGLAFQNPDGSIGLGLTTVTTPGGIAIHVDAVVSLASLGGLWRDSAGHAGTFVLTPGAGTAGAPRPTPSGGLPIGGITGVHIAPGSIGAEHLSPAALGVVVSTLGLCPDGQFVAGFGPNAQLVCLPLPPH